MLKRKKLMNLNDEELKELIRRMHHDELKSVLAMSKELDVSRDTINRWFVYFDIPFRSGSEANKVRFSKMGRDERKAITKKANEAVRGSKRPEAVRIKQALTTSNRAVMSEAEQDFAIHLIRNGLYDFIFSYPYDVFNIDFAFPAHKIAVEVDGGNWHSTERKQEQDRKKEEFLTSEGWTILRWSTAPHLVGRLPDVIALLKKSVLT